MKGLDEQIPYGHIVYPTDAEFKDFNAYMTKLSQSPKYKDASLVKVT